MNMSVKVVGEGRREECFNFYVEAYVLPTTNGREEAPLPACASVKH